MAGLPLPVSRTPGLGGISREIVVLRHWHGEQFAGAQQSAVPSGRVRLITFDQGGVTFSYKDYRASRGTARVPVLASSVAGTIR